MTDNDLELYMRSGPMSLLRRYFSNGYAAILAYSDLLQSGFSFEKAMEKANDADADIVEYKWYALVAPKFSMSPLGVVALFFGKLHVDVEHKRIDFSTFHSVPRGRAGVLKLRWMFSRLLYGLFLFALIVSGSLAVLLGLAFLLYGEKEAFAQQEEFQSFLQSGIAFFCSLLGLSLTKLIGLPRFARALARYPIAVISVSVVNWRKYL